MKYFLLLIVGIFVLAFFSCKEFKEAEVTGVKSFRVTKVSTEGIEAEIILGIKNPNPIGFSIYPSEFDVIFSGINLGKAKLYKRVHIDANSEKPYVFKLKSLFQKFNFMDITNLLSGNKIGIVEVKGDLIAGKFYLKKRFPVNIREKADLKP